MNNVIEARGLTRRYGELVAVRSVSFGVAAGEIFGFLGPNGAGKTTTQRMLTGVLPPSEGTAQVLDHDMAGDPLGAKQHIGVVPEAANPYRELTGWQNAMLFGRLYGVPGRRRKRRAETLLRQFELWPRRGDAVGKYSKGMKQRLMLAMALMHEPQVLFLDDPTSGLDVASRRLIHAIVRKLAARGTAVFYTTHDIEEANLLCDRVAIICRGQLAAVDTPEALKAAFAGSQVVQVAFANPVRAEDLAGLPGARRVEKRGDKLHVYTSAPDAVVAGLVDRARAKAWQLQTISTLGASLEEVFVSLTEPGVRSP